MNDVTIVFTSCGRFDFLKKTIDSFMSMNTYDIKKIIVIDNSSNKDGFDIINGMFRKHKVETQIIINETNIGQVASIDKAYSFVETNYIFHCEDDWIFTKPNFIEKSLDVLSFDEKISNINIRYRFNGQRGSMHPINPNPKKTNNGVIYYEYALNFLNEWHGFSWNPGLRRKSDYDLIKPYKQYVNEQGVGLVYKNLDFKSACLEEQYCYHIGGDETTPLANE